MEPFHIENIEHEDQCNKCLSLIDSLMDLNPEPKSKEGIELEMLVVLVEAYEKDRYSI